MVERRVRVASPVGLHARPAASFVKAVAAAPVGVRIAKGDGPAVDAASILSVLGLAVEHGDEVVLSAHGARAEETLDRLSALLGEGN